MLKQRKNYSMGFEDDVRKANIKGIITGSIISAIGFLVALQWNAVIKETIDLFVPKGQGLIYLYISAIIITFVAIFLVFVLLKIRDTKIVPPKFTKLRVKKRK